MVATQPSILVDTNVLLRAIQHDDPLCPVARKALKSAFGAERHTNFLETLRDPPGFRVHIQHVEAVGCAYGVLGVRVYDAWLAAAMTARGVRRILTFNARDFARYDGIDSVDPRSV